jgi:Ni/Fe-hydrogenase subunit HybB-like protein
MMKLRFEGPYSSAYWALILCNVLVPQALWFRKVRRDTRALLFVAIVINIGMWLERYVIVVTSLSNDFLPSSWGLYSPTFWDLATYAGSFGLFGTLLLLFIRFLPMISIFEMKTIVPEAGTAKESEDE